MYIEQLEWLIKKSNVWRGWQKVYMYSKLVINVKINLWHVNFKERLAQFVNLWSILKPDLPPIMKPAYFFYHFVKT